MFDISEERKIYYITEYKYKHNIPISRLARRFNLSRDKAYRYLKRAEELGIVKKILYPPDLVKLEKKVEKNLKLRNVFISHRGKSEKEKIELLASAANWYINRLIKNDMIITVGGGQTLGKCADSFKLENPQGKIKSLTTCTLNTDIITSGKGELPKYVSSVIAQTFHRKFDDEGIVSNFVKFHVSGVKDKKDKEFHIERCEDCKTVLKRIRKSDMILAGIGCLRKGIESTTTKYLRYCKMDIKKLYDEKIVGEIAFNYFTINKKIIKTSIDNFMISLSVEDIKEISAIKKRRYVIGIAIGEEKVEAIIGAARAGLINILITDEDTAKSLITKNI